MQDSSLDETQKQYATAKIEVQVGSVLMHAWAEVEHDLIYKPESGELSQTTRKPSWMRSTAWSSPVKSRWKGCNVLFSAG